LTKNKPIYTTFTVSLLTISMFVYMLAPNLQFCTTGLFSNCDGLPKAENLCCPMSSGADRADADEIYPIADLLASGSSCYPAGSTAAESEPVPVQGCSGCGCSLSETGSAADTNVIATLAKPGAKELLSAFAYSFNAIQTEILLSDDDARASESWSSVTLLHQIHHPSAPSLVIRHCSYLI
jgi:hypothetical protein